MGKKIGSGIWFIFFGIIILLHNFDVIKFNFYATIKYWPLLIIAIGVNLILQNRPNGSILSAAFNLIACIFITFIGLTSTETIKLDFLTKSASSQDTTGMSQHISVPFVDSTETASLQFNLGATALTLDSIPSDSLIYVRSQNSNVLLGADATTTDKHIDLEINTQVKSEVKDKNKINFALHTKPLWNMEFNMGAANFVGNFKKYNLSNLEINAGAASLNLTLGVPKSNTTTIEINSAASNCSLSIPNEAACRVELNSFVSSKRLDGFTKKDEYYQTDNYDTAHHKYNISISGAANSLKINRY